ncbi:phosphatase PAP2 family protein [Flavobacterium agricola]|uniref:Phosphatase PAP2 family protein n=1 Tax=Flavobacterium agricola TaxID=2870839 RepID=A0ABY6LYP9_9FLAO|nr:phosphatase PAP2 family protein [Flavobacterium agricola]UYW00672.1 phosphatase PAP2 family protein [Flavobacterium agricola]
MLDKFINLDQQLLIYLNNLGTPTLDTFFLIITQWWYLIPVFGYVFYLMIKKIGWKNFGLVVLVMALLILFTDQSTNLVKKSVERLRPCNEPGVKEFLRSIITRQSFSFFSGHASNSMATTLFIYLLLRNYYTKYLFLLFLFPLLFAYSRVYLGLHYPLDILVGYAFGACTGFVFYKLYQFLNNKYFPAANHL